jgi:MFS family permease
VIRRGAGVRRRAAVTALVRSPARPGPGTARPSWGLLFVLSGNMLLDALEVSVMIIALPAIGDDLALPLARTQWLVSGFALGFGGSLLAGRRVVELLGRRRMYLIALAGFALASLAGGLASTAALLVATRVVKGCCAALTATTGLAMISTNYPAGRPRERAISVYTLFGASGFSLGLLLSGLLTTVSWRWTMLFAAPVALALLAAGLRYIPRDPRRAQGHGGSGLAGALAFVGGSALLVYAFVRLAGRGPADPAGLAALLAGVLLLAGFARADRSARRPLLPPAVLAHRPLIWAGMGAAALNGSYWGLLLIITLHLQAVRGWGPLPTGLALLPASLPLASSAMYAGRMVSRFGAARLVALGAAAPPVGYALALRLDPAAGYLTDILPTLLLVGLGFVLGFAALHVRATEGVPDAQQGVASAAYQSAVQLGGALTVALVAGLLVRGGTAPGPPDRVAMAYRPALVLLIAVGVAGLLVALTGLRPPRAA